MNENEMQELAKYICRQLGEHRVEVCYNAERGLFVMIVTLCFFNSSIALAIPSPQSHTMEEIMDKIKDELDGFIVKEAEEITERRIAQV